MFLCKYNLSSFFFCTFQLPGTSWSSVQTGVTCFTTSPPCDSRRSEGESGGEHALTTSHVELKQEKESPFLRQFRNVKDVSVNYERIDVQRVGSAIWQSWGWTLLYCPSVECRTWASGVDREYSVRKYRLSDKMRSSCTCGSGSSITLLEVMQDL